MPEHVLPPITTSELAANRDVTATVLQRRVSKPTNESVLPDSPDVSTTLGALARGLTVDEDASGWSPGEVLKDMASQVRRSGSALAGAALSKMGG